MGKRRESRILALKSLYVYESIEENIDIEKIMDDLLENDDTIESDNSIKNYAINLAKKVLLNTKNFNKIIESCTKNWTIDRMALLDRNILKIAMVEIFLQDNVPDIVAIDEAIEIAKTFSTEDSGGFVNGILDYIVKNKEKFTEFLK